MERRVVDDIVQDVRMCMDEAAENEAEFLLSTDQEEMDALIRSKLVDAYRSIHMVANPLLLTPVIEEKEVKSDERGVVRVDILNTYARILGVALDGWSRYVSEFVGHMDASYAELKNPITTGTKDRPRAALLAKDEDYKTLELYSTDKGADTTCTLETIPDWGYNTEVVEATEGESEKVLYKISRKVYRAFVHYAAGLVFQTYKDAHGDALMQLGLAMVA